MLIRWGQISLLALLAVFTLFIAGDVRKAASQESIADADGAASLDDLIPATGRVESADTIDVRCEVPGTSTIVELFADGTEVKAGDLLVKLDDAPLKSQLAEQQIAVSQARAVLEQAQARLATQDATGESHRELLALKLEIAELELKRYQDAELPLEIQRSESRIQIAEQQVAALSQRVERLESSQQAVAPNQLDTARVELAEAEAGLDLARLSQRLLTSFDGPLNTRKLELQVVEARLVLEQTVQTGSALRTEAEAGVSAATVALEQAEQQLSVIRDQIEQCTIHAPRDGVVIQTRQLVARTEGGYVVRGGQSLFQMPNLERLHGQLSVDEEDLARIRVGQPVTLFVGDSEERLQGRVTSVGDRKFNARVPRARSDTAQYSVLVEFDDPAPRLRIGTQIRALIDVAGTVDADQ